MRKIASLVLTAGLALTAAPAGSAERAEEVQLYVGGTTPLVNGYFFPGTMYFDGQKYQSTSPLEVPKGSNVILTNLDESSVANIHQVRSLKKTKKGRPLFSSKPVYSPGDQVKIRTARLKPGNYKYICTTHSTMVGEFQVVRP